MVSLPIKSTHCRSRQSPQPHHVDHTREVVDRGLDFPVGEAADAPQLDHHAEQLSPKGSTGVAQERGGQVRKGREAELHCYALIYH
jgi:hypothetical protein